MKCPHCQSELTLPLSTYPDNNGTITVTRCFACNANITVREKNIRPNKLKRMTNSLKVALVLLFITMATTLSAQHYIGYQRGDILCLAGYNPDVKAIEMSVQAYNGITFELLEVDFATKAHYYYLNPINHQCESFAAVYSSVAAKDSLICLFDSLYQRVDYPNDPTAIAWIEYEDGINYERIVREFAPPTCLVILAITQKVEN